MPAAQLVRSRANPLFKRLRQLKERGSHGDLCLLEGPKLVLEALAAGVPLVEAAFAARAESTPVGSAALEALRARGVPLRPLSDELIASLSEAEGPQGLLALAHRPSFAEERIFCGVPLVLVADGVQNPGNLGGLLRSAEAAGASGAFVTQGSADPFSWKALRGSMGSAFRLPHVGGLSIDAVLDRLQARGLALVATGAGGDRGYDEADLRGPTAIVVGAEGSGLAPSVLRRATACLRIPLAAPVESLNVAVAGALVLYEAARQRGFPARAAARG